MKTLHSLEYVGSGEMGSNDSKWAVRLSDRNITEKEHQILIGTLWQAGRSFVRCVQYFTWTGGRFSNLYSDFICYFIIFYFYFYIIFYFSFLFFIFLVFCSYLLFCFIFINILAFYFNFILSLLFFIFRFLF